MQKSVSEMLAQGSSNSDKSKARKLSCTNSTQNSLNGLDEMGEPDCKRIKTEGAVPSTLKCEDGSLSALPGQGESVPDGTGSWGDVSIFVS